MNHLRIVLATAVLAAPLGILVTASSGCGDACNDLSQLCDFCSSDAYTNSCREIVTNNIQTRCQQETSIYQQFCVDPSTSSSSSTGGSGGTASSGGSGGSEGTASSSSASGSGGGGGTTSSTGGSGGGGGTTSSTGGSGGSGGSGGNGGSGGS